MKKTIPENPTLPIPSTPTPPEARRLMMREKKAKEEKERLRKMPKDPCPGMISIKGNNGYGEGNYYTPMRPDSDDL